MTIFKSTSYAKEVEIRNEMAKHLADKRRKQPLGNATTGNSFKRPQV
jgi:UDP-N-acetylenolpyruvoylglucosamine reductase